MYGIEKNLKEKGEGFQLIYNTAKKKKRKNKNKSIVVIFFKPYTSKYTSFSNALRCNS